MWHCDGYDKLKPFGIAIHGCIDGQVILYCNLSILKLTFMPNHRYSRRVMWLHTAMSNNKPEYIATYFVECIRTIRGENLNKYPRFNPMKVRLGFPFGSDVTFNTILYIFAWFHQYPRTHDF